MVSITLVHQPMNFLKNILHKKEDPIQSYHDFWNWFQKNERNLYKVIKEKRDVKENFFNILSPKLDELRDGYHFTAGMSGDGIVRLTFTADGVIENIVFVEELVQSAPEIKGWKIIALKQPIDEEELDIDSVSIDMSGYTFNTSNLSFYAIEDPAHPDEIDITVVYHDDFDEKAASTISSGTSIFLEHYLGELRFATAFDNITVVGKSEAEKELVPILKLRDFLIWREKEFIEKYEGLRHNTENDNYSGFTAETEEGKPVIAVINTDLLAWDSKASHPWTAIIEINYNGVEDSGLPDEETLHLLDDIENNITGQLQDFEGYLNVGRETSNNIRAIFFACKDFRKPSRVFDEIQHTFADSFEISFGIFKDKYWRSFSRFEVG
jgi:hypothetical protein